MGEPNDCPWVTVVNDVSYVCGTKCWGTVHCDQHQRLVDEAGEDSEFIIFKVEYDLRNKDKN